MFSAKKNGADKFAQLNKYGIRAPVYISGSSLSLKAAYYNMKRKSFVAIVMSVLCMEGDPGLNVFDKLTIFRLTTNVGIDFIFSQAFMLKMIL